MYRTSTGEKVSPLIEILANDVKVRLNLPDTITFDLAMLNLRQNLEQYEAHTSRRRCKASRVGLIKDMSSANKRQAMK